MLHESSLELSVEESPFDFSNKKINNLNDYQCVGDFIPDEIKHENFKQDSTIFTGFKKITQSIPIHGSMGAYGKSYFGDCIIFKDGFGGNFHTSNSNENHEKSRVALSCCCNNDLTIELDGYCDFTNLQLIISEDYPIVHLLIKFLDFIHILNITKELIYIVENGNSIFNSSCHACMTYSNAESNLFDLSKTSLYDYIEKGLCIDYVDSWTTHLLNNLRVIHKTHDDIMTNPAFTDNILVSDKAIQSSEILNVYSHSFKDNAESGAGIFKGSFVNHDNEKFFIHFHFENSILTFYTMDLYSPISVFDFIMKHAFKLNVDGNVLNIIHSNTLMNILNSSMFSINIDNFYLNVIDELSHNLPLGCNGLNGEAGIGEFMNSACSFESNADDIGVKSFSSYNRHSQSHIIQNIWLSNQRVFEKNLFEIKFNPVRNEFAIFDSIKYDLLNSEIVVGNDLRILKDALSYGENMCFKSNILSFILDYCIVVFSICTPFTVIGGGFIDSFSKASYRNDLIIIYMKKAFFITDFLLFDRKLDISNELNTSKENICCDVLEMDLKHPPILDGVGFNQDYSIFKTMSVGSDEHMDDIAAFV